MVGRDWVEDDSLAASRIEALAKGLPEEYRSRICSQMGVLLDYIRMNSIPSSVAIDSYGRIAFDFTDIDGMPLDHIVAAVTEARSSGQRLSSNPIYEEHVTQRGEKIYHW